MQMVKENTVFFFGGGGGFVCLHPSLLTCILYSLCIHSHMISLGRIKQSWRGRGGGAGRVGRVGRLIRLTQLTGTGD